MVITDDKELARRAKHLTPTAKVPHPYEFVHDEVGYNYRLPNLNAALGCAQMELLPKMLEIKAEVAARYRDFFAGTGVRFVEPLPGTTANCRKACRRALANARGQQPTAGAGQCGVLLRGEQRGQFLDRCAHGGSL